MIQNKIGREDEQIHLEILSIFAPDDRKNHGGFFQFISTSFVEGNLQYKCIINTPTKIWVT